MNVLIIAESPAKALTIELAIQKLLNNEQHLGGADSTELSHTDHYTVKSTQGCVRELKAKDGNVDTSNHFATNYQLVTKNKKHIEAITDAVTAADVVYLAHNPDREGEASAWQLLEAIQTTPDLLKNKTIKRLILHNLSENSILSALQNPCEISDNTVKAQQADDVINHLFNLKLSHLLGLKIRRGLAIGRLQIPALRFIIEKEKEISRFQESEYWVVEAELSAKKKTFSAKLTQYQTTTLSKMSIDSADIVDAIDTTLTILTKGKLTVSNIETTQEIKEPPGPFTTATLQQAASRKLNFTALRTMRAAKQLFEGIDLGETAISESQAGATGLISFMHTDSAHLPTKTAEEIHNVIQKKYGEKYLAEKPAREKDLAEESLSEEKGRAIYPVFAAIIPSKIKSKLTADQFKLYNLIWKRSIASQMLHANIDTSTVEFDAVQGRFCASNHTTSSPSFMKVYAEEDNEAENENQAPPTLKVGDKVKLNQIKSSQQFTRPPSRFTEASLLKHLKEERIGRPENTASIIATLLNKEYIELEKKQFYPTDIGRVLSKFLSQHLTPYAESSFSAKLEANFQAVSRGEQDQQALLQHFWEPLDELIHKKTDSIDRKDITQETINEICPKCGEPLSIRLGRLGRFIGCTTYPICDYTRGLKNSKSEEKKTDVADGKTCPECQSALVLKQGRYGKFVGCSAYPECKHMEPLDRPEDSGISCPQCKKGSILKRKSRLGKIFYSCSAYPDCKYAIWHPPLAEGCPDCRWPLLTIRTSKRNGAEKVCPQKGCRFSQPID